MTWTSQQIIFYITFTYNTTRRTGHKERMGEIRHAHRTAIGRSDTNRHLETPKHRPEIILKWISEKEYIVLIGLMYLSMRTSGDRPLGTPRHVLNIILKWIWEKQYIRVLIGSTYLRLSSSGEKHLGKPRHGLEIILKWTLEKQYMKILIGLITYTSDWEPLASSYRQGRWNFLTS